MGVVLVGFGAPSTSSRLRCVPAYGRSERLFSAPCQAGTAASPSVPTIRRLTRISASDSSAAAASSSSLAACRVAQPHPGGQLGVGLLLRQLGAEPSSSWALIDSMAGRASTSMPASSTRWSTPSRRAGVSRTVSPSTLDHAVAGQPAERRQQVARCRPGVAAQLVEVRGGLGQELSEAAAEFDELGADAWEAAGDPLAGALAWLAGYGMVEVTGQTVASRRSAPRASSTWSTTPTSRSTRGRPSTR